MANEKVGSLSEVITQVLGSVDYLTDSPGGSQDVEGTVLAEIIGRSCGTVYTTGGSGSQSIGTTFEKITQIDSNGGSFGGVTPDAANNKISVSRGGSYMVSLQCSFSGSSNAEYTVAVYVGGSATTGLQFVRKLGTGGDVGSASCMGIVPISAGQDVEIYAKADAGSKDIDVSELQLSVFRLGP